VHQLIPGGSTSTQPLPLQLICKYKRFVNNYKTNCRKFVKKHKMSTETTERKVYPSQLNSKTISARIPVQDYVNFLNESIDLGISLNDFLLRKIYTSASNNKVSAVNTESELTDELLNFINGHKFEVIEIEDKEDYWNGENLHNYNNPIQTNRLVQMNYKENGGSICFYTLQQIEEFIGHQSKYIKQLKSDKTPNLMDIKVQIRSLVRSKIHRNDQDEYLKEINRLLKELE
jgi:hypothetical protein